VQWDPIANNGVIGSGPFAFESWSPNQTHVLKTHKAHWAAPAYDGIRRLSLGQADAVRAAMVDGTADIATTVLPSATMEQLAQSEDHLEFLASQSFSTLTVWVNHQKAPFNDLSFRKALRLATDKERVALEGWIGFSVPAGEGNVPIGLGAWHNPNLEKIPFDIDAARKVLEEAGYGWDSDGRLHLPPAAQ
jgi:peptide/nickel transport system substrate-binding protein